MKTIVLAVTGLVSSSLLVSACGGSSNDGSVASSQGQSGAVAFARCMRSHRVPNWPDPDSSGAFDKSKLTSQRLGAGESQIHAARTACDHLLPNGGNGPSAARLQQVKAEGLQFAQCVRAHGVPGFPDPGTDGRIPDPATVGIDQGSPKFQAANGACGRYRPPYMPSNAAYDTWARAHGQ